MSISAEKNEDGEEIGLCAEILPDEKQVEGMTDEEIYEKIKKLVSDLNTTLPQYKSVHTVVIRKEAFDKTTTGKIKRNYNK